MNKHKSLGILLAVLVFFSCSNELELNADRKDIPVVYGLLSATSQSQYIRVERVFIDPNIPPGEIALIPDSIYYPELYVELENLTKGIVLPMQEINGADEGLPRDNGLFATVPNILYKIDSKDIGIEPGDQFKLNIQRSENQELIQAETSIIDTVRISQPSSRINFDYISDFRIQWFPITNVLEPSLYDAGILIRYRELNTSDQDPEWINKSVYWPVANGVTDNEVLRNGKEFYIFLSNNLEVRENLRRDFLGMDIIVDAGGEEIVDYIRVGQANLGITASQEVPVYTNLSEGRGIFSSRNRAIRKNILLSPISQDSLENGAFTKDLNFTN